MFVGDFCYRLICRSLIIARFSASFILTLKAELNAFMLLLNTQIEHKFCVLCHAFLTFARKKITALTIIRKQWYNFYISTTVSDLLFVAKSKCGINAATAAATTTATTTTVTTTTICVYT